MTKETRINEVRISFVHNAGGGGLRVTRRQGRGGIYYVKRSRGGLIGRRERCEVFQR